MKMRAEIGETDSRRIIETINKTRSSFVQQEVLGVFRQFPCSLAWTQKTLMLCFMLCSSAVLTFLNLFDQEACIFALHWVPQIGSQSCVDV